MLPPRRPPRSPSTVSNIAKELGLTFERGAEVVAATEAHRIDLAARRVTLPETLHEDAEKPRAQLWEPCTVGEFAGKEGDWHTANLDRPPMGRSDYAAPIHDQFAALDDVWTSWMRDIRLARARLVVPSAYLTSNGPGQGASFDDDREVYSALNVPPNEGAGITMNQFAIRVDEYQRTAEALTRKAVESAGYSAQSFGLEGGGEAMTATEVEDRAGRSTTTTKKKAGHWRAKLADFLHAYQLLAAAQFGARITPERPTVEFRLDAAESEQSKATTLELYARAGAVSTATKVKYRSPDMEDTAVKAEVAAILAETGMGAPDPGAAYPM